jgi:hypothetical protein
MGGGMLGGPGVAPTPLPRATRLTGVFSIGINLTFGGLSEKQTFRTLTNGRLVRFTRISDPRWTNLSINRED